MSRTMLRKTALWIAQQAFQMLRRKICNNPTLFHGKKCSRSARLTSVTHRNITKWLWIQTNWWNRTTNNSFKVWSYSSSIQITCQWCPHKTVPWTSIIRAVRRHPSKKRRSPPRRSKSKSCPAICNRLRLLSLVWKTTNRRRERIEWYSSHT